MSDARDLEKLTDYLEELSEALGYDEGTISDRFFNKIPKVGGINNTTEVYQNNIREYLQNYEQRLEQQAIAGGVKREQLNALREEHGLPDIQAEYRMTPEAEAETKQLGGYAADLAEKIGADELSEALSPETLTQATNHALRAYTSGTDAERQAMEDKGVIEQDSAGNITVHLDSYIEKQAESIEQAALDKGGSPTLSMAFGKSMVLKPQLRLRQNPGF